MTARAQRTPTFFWQGALILLPVGVMTALGLTAIVRDRAAVEVEAQGRAREILLPLAPGLAQRFALQLARLDFWANTWAEHQRARINADLQLGRAAGTLAPPHWFREDRFGEYFPRCRAAFTNCPIEDLLPNRLLFTAEGGLSWPPGYDVPPLPPRWFMDLRVEQRVAWETLCQTRAGKAKPGECAAAAKKFLETDPPAEARANAEFLDLTEPLTNPPALPASATLLAFARSHPGVAAESGLPLATVALARALTLVSPAAEAPPLWPALREQVCQAPSMLVPALLARARPFAAKDANANEWFAALAAQWASEERLRDLGKAFRDRGEWAGMSPTSGWLSAREDRWFFVANPSRFVLDSFGQARLGTNTTARLEVRFYPSAAVRACLAEAVRETPMALPRYLGLTAELEGEALAARAGAGAAGPRVVAETQELLKQPVVLVSDPLEPYLAVGYDGEPPLNSVRQPAFPSVEVDSLSTRPRLTLRLSLVDPTLLFAQQRQRTLLYGTVIGVSCLAALAGLAAARRAFYRQLRLNELKSNFVSSVSHELRAPIASVRLMAESLERGKIAEEPKRRDYFRFIGQECRRLSSLIENVLDFSRIEQGRKRYDFEPTDLVALVRRTVDLMQTYAAERQVEIALAIPDAQVTVLSTQPVVDGKSVQQALVNLVDNAVKHSPKGARVTVGLEARGGKEAGAADRVWLWVEDHGEGIPLEEQGKIFERFYRRGAELRRETQGVGIGLSIVKHLVEAHDGRVLVRSAVGQGSRFTIELPMAGPETSATIS